MNTCIKCHKPIYDSISIAFKMGPVCRAKYYQQSGGQITMFNRLMKWQDILKVPRIKNWKRNIELKRIDGEATFNFEQRIIHHSPSGMEWGYLGSGPSEAALNILAIYLGGKTAVSYSNQFKEAFLANIPEAGGIIKHKEIKKWIKENVKND